MATTRELNPLTPETPRTRDLPLGTGLQALIRTASSVVVEARPRVLMIGGMRFLGGALLSGGAVLSWPVARGLAAWLLVTLSVYVLNGVSDVDADRLNGSRRPIAAGTLSVKVAKAAVLGSTLGGLALGASVSATLLVHLAIAVALGVGYSVGPRPAKARSGSAFVVVVGGGLVTYHAGLVAASGHVTLPFLAFSVCLSLWMGIGSLLKDLTDTEGDRAAGRLTLAITHGPSATAALATGGAAVIAAVLAWSATGSHALTVHLALPAIILVLGVAALAAAYVRIRGRAGIMYQLFMYTQIASHGALLTVA